MNITNVTTATTLTKSTWTLPCDVECDEVIIRQITFSSDDTSRGIFLIEASFNSGVIIGTICNTEAFSASPNMHIQLRQPLGGHISFQLMLPNGKPARNVLGDISISMDLIRTRKWKSQE